MASDIFWKGRQPDNNVQRKCSYVLQKFFMDIDFFHKAYNKTLFYPIISLNNSDFSKRHKKITLCGITSWHIPSDDDNFSGIADRQFSFVFNNSDYLPESEIGELITYEEIANTKSERFQKIKEVITEDFNNNTPLGAYSGLNHIRVLTKEVDFFIKVLFLTKSLFVESIEVSDDYLLWEKINTWAEKTNFFVELNNCNNFFDKTQFCLHTLFNFKIDESFLSNDLLEFWEIEKNEFFKEI